MSDDNKEKDKEFVPKTEDEVRQEVTEEFGFDAEDEDDKKHIETVTKKSLEHQKNLSSAITQKGKHRDSSEKHAAKLKELGIDPETGDEIKKEEKKPAEETKPKEDKATTERLDRIELENLGDLSDELTEEVKEMAKIKGISFKKAFNSDYIQFKVKQAKDKTDNEEAGLGDDKGAPLSDKKIASTKPEDVKNLSDEDFEKYKEKHLKDD